MTNETQNNMKTKKLHEGNNLLLTLHELLKSDVEGEDFQLAFYYMLEKLVLEHTDMQYMEATKQAQKLLDTINEY